MAGGSERNSGSNRGRSGNHREAPVKNATRMTNDDHSDRERLKEATRTALILSSMKYDELEPETARTLLKMRKRTLGKPKTEANSLPKSQPEQPVGEEEDGREVMEQRQIAQIPILPPTELELPRIGYSIDGTELPRFPPVKSLREKIGNCSKPLEKQLTRCDVDSRQSRLSFNKDVMKEAILPFLGSDAENLAFGIPVTVYDSKRNSYQMVLKTWGNSNYVLTEGWAKFCVEHGFKEYEDWISMWMFRHKHTRKYCFVLTFRRFPIYSSMGKKSSKATGIKITG